MAEADQITAAYLKRLHEQMQDIHATLRLFNDEFVHRHNFAQFKEELADSHQDLKKHLAHALTQEHSQVLSDSLRSVQTAIDTMGQQQTHLQEELARLHRRLDKFTESHKDHATHAANANHEAISHHVHLYNRQVSQLSNQIAQLREALQVYDARLSANYGALDKKINDGLLVNFNTEPREVELNAPFAEKNRQHDSVHRRSRLRHR